MKKIFFFYFFISIITLNTLVAQDKESKPIELIHTNYLYSSKKLGKDIQILKGQVIVSHINTTIYCDSAFIDRKKNLMKGFGDVRVIKVSEQDTVLLYCDSLNYEANKGNTYFAGNVRLYKDTIKLFTSELKYDFKSDEAIYEKKGKILTKTDTLISVKGYYNPSKKILAFAQNVVMKSQKYDIYTDSLFHDLNKKISFFFGKTHIIGDSVDLFTTLGSYDHKYQKAKILKQAQINFKEQQIFAKSIDYNKNSGLIFAQGNVKIIDTVQRYTLTGEFGKMNKENKQFLIYKNAVLTQYRDKDTFWLHSDTIFSFIDTLISEYDTFQYRKVLVYHRVKGFQRDLQVKADSVVYSLLDSTLFLYHQPVLWSDSIQITGNYMELLTLNRDPYKLIVKDNSFIIEHTLEDKFNQIKGKDIEIKFKNRQLKEVEVKSDAQAIYYMFQDSMLMAVNKLSSDTIRIFINNKKIKSILAIGSPRGRIIPPNQLTPSDEQLDGFQWYWYFRPLKPEDIYIWSKKD